MINWSIADRLINDWSMSSMDTPSCHYHITLPSFTFRLKDYIKRKITKCIIVKYLIMVTAFMSITLNFELNIRMSWYGSVIIIIIIILLSFCCCLFIRDSPNCKLVRGWRTLHFLILFIYNIWGGDSNLKTKFRVHITSNIFKIIQFKNHGIAPMTSKHGWRAAPKNWGKAAAILVQSKSRRNCCTFSNPIITWGWHLLILDQSLISYWSINHQQDVRGKVVGWLR